MKSNTQLMELISKMEPLDFVGLTKLLGVPVLEPVDEQVYTSTAPEPQKMRPRPFLDVFEDVMYKFNKLNRSKKRELIKLIKKSNSVRSEEVASNT